MASPCEFAYGAGPQVDEAAHPPSEIATHLQAGSIWNATRGTTSSRHVGHQSAVLLTSRSEAKATGGREE
jgi:hypothetical protein